MIDERVRAELTGLTDALRPQPDPYGRVLARFRRDRRRRVALTAGGLAVLALAAAVPVALRSPGGPPPVAGSPGSEEGWRLQMINSRPRGALTHDAAFVADLGRALADAPGRGPDIPIRPSTPRVLFADDIGSLRVAGVVFVATPEQRGMGLGQDTFLWLVAPRGASAAHLAEALAPVPPGDTNLSGGAEFDPFQAVEMNIQEDRVWLGLAPDRCTVATAPLPAVDVWTPAPTGSYLVRTDAARRPEWWRVTCDGRVRWTGPAPGRRTDGAVTDADLDAALATVRSATDRATARDAVQQANRFWDLQATARPAVLWAGPLPGFANLDGPVTVVTAPLVGGGWGCLLVGAKRPDGTSFLPLRAETDPTAPASLVAIAVTWDGESPGAVLAIPPANARTVRLRHDGQTLAEATVTNRAAVLKAPTVPVDTTADALDAAGTVVATAALGHRSSVDLSGGRTTTWDQP